MAGGQWGKWQCAAKCCRLLSCAASRVREKEYVPRRFQACGLKLVPSGQARVGALRPRVLAWPRVGRRRPAGPEAAARYNSAARRGGKGWSPKSLDGMLAWQARAAGEYQGQPQVWWPSLEWTQASKQARQAAHPHMIPPAELARSGKVRAADGFRRTSTSGSTPGGQRGRAAGRPAQATGSLQRSPPTPARR